MWLFWNEISGGELASLRAAVVSHEKQKPARSLQPPTPTLISSYIEKHAQESHFFSFPYSLPRNQQDGQVTKGHSSGSTAPDAVIHLQGSRVPLVSHPGGAQPDNLVSSVFGCISLYSRRSFECEPESWWLVGSCWIDWMEDCRACVRVVGRIWQCAIETPGKKTVLYQIYGWQLAIHYVGIDITTLTVLSHSPHLYLLGAFYNISPITIITCLVVDSITAYIPLSLLRNTLPTHRWKAPRGTVADRVVVNDIPARLLVSLLAAAIYGLVVLCSFASWLPVYLVIHFDGIRDISAAHNASLPLLISLFFPIGAAAGEFLFRASQGTKSDAHDLQIASFNPETASLRQTLAYNFWGFSARTRALIKRTVTVVVITGLHTWLQTYVAIEGVEAYGAAGWSAVWSLAAAMTGWMFWWVGNVENTYRNVENPYRSADNTYRNVENAYREVENTYRNVEYKRTVNPTKTEELWASLTPYNLKLRTRDMISKEDRWCTSSKPMDSLCLAILSFGTGWYHIWTKKKKLPFWYLSSAQRVWVHYHIRAFHGLLFSCQVFL